mmetsp:Transcript_108129/g.271993  ORF Transcript_108129/g.271993 Transcript_108129/m.271993 type:complete len:307 (-) Transcript_108129:1111-2031(-)
MAVLETGMTAEAALVGIQHTAHRLVPRETDLVVSVAVARVEVEGEEHVTALEGDDFVHVVLHCHVLVLRTQPLEAALAGLHELVKRLEELVTQEVVLRQVPAPTAMMVTPSILWTREVNPLGVAELVSHEVQVAFASEAQNQEADHLVQSEASVDAQGRLRTREEAHAGVHLCVHQPERQGLVAHNGLVVGFCVGHNFLLPPAVRQSVRDVAHIPAIVTAFLEQLDEHVWDGHGQTVVEAEATFGDWPAERGHSADVFADCDSAREDGVDEVIRQHEVDVAINICVGAKVLMVASSVALADAVRVV